MNASPFCPPVVRAAPLAVLVAVSCLAPGLSAQTLGPWDHGGPGVAEGDTGPARYVALLYAAFDPARALLDAAYADRWYRTPGSPGYDATLDRMAERLREHGFGSDPRLTLEFLETEMPNDSWIPLTASLILRVEGRPASVLHAFSKSPDADRTMLPVFAPSADVEGKPVFSLDAVEPGTILVSEARLSGHILRRAEKRGAVAVLSSALFPFTVDPSGAERHRDAILYTKVSPTTKLPVAQISPRAHDRIKEAAAADSTAWLAFSAEVERGGRKLRTLVAEIAGDGRASEAIAIASHVQEPGAGDNASGIAGLTETACTLAGLLRAGELPWPTRTLAFVWGDEILQSEVWLDATNHEVIAGISADMLGQSPSKTGSVALLERTPDPGAVVTILPDKHTPWGAGEVLEEDLAANGLALVARVALHDVARHAGGWTTSENPWEGGSDHDVFIDHGIPGVLLWHFTDFTYHTSLDRMDMLDGEELRLSCVAILATALAVAGAEEGDLERYLATNELERELRMRAAEEASEPGAAALWGTWCDGAAVWLDQLCRPAGDR